MKNTTAIWVTLGALLAGCASPMPTLIVQLTYQATESIIALKDTKGRSAVG